MQVKNAHKITLTTEETILAATVSSSNEVVLLMSSGSVFKYAIAEDKADGLFSIKTAISYTDGGFDLNAQSTIYTLDEIVVVVNDYKRHGFVHYPENYQALHLWREDYHADISCYPIALFKNEEGVPHLIYGVAWNHLQIMNLDTRQVLTASKSLIEENAEERHIEFYKKYNDVNKLPWPTPYDYFFGKLQVSPNQKYFLSAGWVWGSFDAYNVYDIDRFISSNRIADIGVGGWIHTNRAACWIGNQTVAVAYEPFAEGDEGASPESPFEIHFYKIAEGTAELERRIQISDLNINIVEATMHYDERHNAIVAFSEAIGLAVLNLEGTLLFHDQSLKIDEYRVEAGTLLKAEDKTISIYEIVPA